MIKTPTEEEIQKVLEIIKKDHPEQATRENAIKVIGSLKSMANTMLDRIEDDLKSGKVEINEKGEVMRDGKVIKKTDDSEDVSEG